MTQGSVTLQDMEKLSKQAAMLRQELKAMDAARLAALQASILECCISVWCRMCLLVFSALLQLGICCSQTYHRRSSCRSYSQGAPGRQGSLACVHIKCM